MQFLYLQTCVLLQPVVQIFFSLVLLSVEMPKRKRKNLDVDTEFFKDVICIFLCYSVQPSCRGYAVPILRKNCNPLPLFPFNNTPLSKYSTYSFLLQLPCLPTQPLFNHTFSWKNNSSIPVQILHAFFKSKIFTNKTQKAFYRSSYRTCQTSKLELFRKKLTAYTRK